MKTHLGLIACLVSLGCSQRQAVESRIDGTRFQNTEAIVVAPFTGLSPVISPDHPPVPRIPTGRLGSNARVTATVAYVVDTSGAIERGTVSFIEPVPPDYRRTVCEWSRKARFEPLVVDGSRKRGVSVSSFVFFRTNNIFKPGEFPSPAEQVLTTLGKMPASELFPFLEAKPHCG